MAAWVFIGATFCWNHLLLCAGFAKPAVAWLLGLASSGLAVGWAASQRSRGAARVRSAAWCLAILGATVACSLWLALGTFDLSCDGLGYHLPAIRALADGWNPIRDPPLPAGPYENTWINHYPKGPWVFAAGAYSALGHLEAGKSLNLIAMAAAFLLAFSALSNWMRPRAATILAALIALNPVCICEAFTHYVDGVLYCALASLIAMLVLVAVRFDRITLLAMALCAVFAVNIKFTAIAYVGVISGGVLATIFFRGQRTRAIQLGRWAAGAGLAGVLVFGFNPYLTNFIRAGHPFYPLFGRGAIDVMGGQMPAEFLSKHRAEKLVAAMFAESSNDFTRLPRLKRPLTVLGRELRAFEAADVRLGGFGPAFGTAMIVSLLVAASLLVARRNRAVLLLSCATIALSVVMNPELWWARYVPQFWLFPIVIGCFAVQNGTRFGMLGFRVLVAVIAVNAALVAFPSARNARAGTHAVRRQIEELVGDGRLHLDVAASPAVRWRLAEAGVHFEEVGALPCAAPLQVAHSSARYCRE